jgi:hypothetical protein
MSVFEKSSPVHRTGRFLVDARASVKQSPTFRPAACFLFSFHRDLRP